MAEKLDLDALAIAMYGAAMRYKKGEAVDFQHEAREFLLESASQPGSGEAVAKIVGVDEYGPQIQWSKHWVELNGRTLYVKDQE